MLSVDCAPADDHHIAAEDDSGIEHDGVAEATASAPMSTSGGDVNRCTRTTGSALQWQSKVEEVSERGVTLNAILEFYAHLFETMLDFSPTRSTTHEVVSGSVVPLTADLGQFYTWLWQWDDTDRHRDELGAGAFATLASYGEAVLPSKMVTHHWANVFSHTVAAIVADALEEEYYGSRVDQLKTADGTRALINTLRAQGLLQSTYWLCALSINQHRSICRGCPCALEKYIDGPLSEMNKFADMMACIKDKNPDFQHVIVVDKHFGIFGRAWCVAELVEGNALGLSQRLLIFDSESVKVNRSSLSSLDVSECEASRPEDKELILSKIMDVQAFNLHLRNLLSEGESSLFGQWAAKALQYAADATLGWDEVSNVYVSRLASVSDADFRSSMFQFSIVPLAVVVWLFALVPSQNPADGWKANTNFWFLFFPGWGISIMLFHARFHTEFLPGMNITWEIIRREVVWVLIVVICGDSAYATIAIHYDIFPVPLGSYVAAALSIGFLPLVYFVFPVSYRKKPGFWKHFLTIGSVSGIALYTIFAFLYPLIYAWYLISSPVGQSLVVLIFLVSRLLFEMLGVCLSKSFGADVLPRFVFFTLTLYEWQMGVILARASHWSISMELCCINVLENMYFVHALPSRSRNDPVTDLKSMRILMVLLARELAEVWASWQWFASLLCIYWFNPDGNDTTRGLSAKSFYSNGATYVGIDVVVELVSLLLTCVVVRAKGWDPFTFLRGFIGLHGGFFVRCCLVCVCGA